MQPKTTDVPVWRLTEVNPMDPAYCVGRQLWDESACKAQPQQQQQQQQPLAAAEWSSSKATEHHAAADAAAGRGSIVSELGLGYQDLVT